MSINKNDKIILDQIIDQQHKERAPKNKKSEFFEMFVAEQILKEYDLGLDEIEAGLIGSGGDGGIDAMYTLINGDMVMEDTNLEPFKKNIFITIVVIQTKLSESFKEDSIRKMIAASEEIFNLANDLHQLQSVYNKGLLSGAEIFRNTYKDLAKKFPTLEFRFIYASKGSDIHPNVKRKSDLLENKIKELFSNADFKFDFLGASELLGLTRRQAPTSYELALAESPISSAGEVGYICLVRLHDYSKFIQDENGQLRRNIFEANVRDYQGPTEVNGEIAQSLEVKGREDFWWLNNGITMIALKATQSGKTITLEEPQIVNGLQTSTEIHRYFSKSQEYEDERNVLVRVIVPTKDESRDRVIKATNSQTKIPPASLWATDKIHRDIEEYLRQYDLYYDRRKSYYKNESRPSEKIIGIPLMAQAVMAILLQRPNDARARPSSLLKKDSDYKEIFSTELPIEIYKICPYILKKVDIYLRLNTNHDSKERNNIKFYISMRIAALIVGEVSPSASTLAKIDLNKVSDKIINDSYISVKNIYDALGSNDQVAKGTELVKRIKSNLLEIINQKKDVK